MARTLATIAASIVSDVRHLGDVAAWELVRAVAIREGKKPDQLAARVRKLSGRPGIRPLGTYAPNTRGLGGLSSARPASTADIYENDHG